MEVVGGADVGSTLIKHLAASNKATRDKALRVLIKTWLPTQPNLSDDDMKKLWKGLFYCVWHADKLPVQTDLINRLSSLLLRLDFPLCLHYFSTFLLTMRREWIGIDALRLDKFYLFIRRFLHNLFALMKEHNWDLDFSRRFILVLEERSFFADDKFLGNGVNYHITSVFLEELGPFLPIRQEVLEVLFKPFLFAMAKLPDKVLLGKIRYHMFDVLLKMGKQLLGFKTSGEDVVASKDVFTLGRHALTTRLSSTFYELGSSPECRQGNRKVLFALHEEFLKLEKDFTSSGIDISTSDVSDQNEDGVPTLIPIACEGEKSASEITEVDADGINGYAVKVLKKKKAGKNSGGGGKKIKKTQKGILLPKSTSVNKENEDFVVHNGRNPDNENMSDDNLITFNESVISNLQIQFEKVAAEFGSGNNVAINYDCTAATHTDTISKKRKRAKNASGKHAQNPEITIPGDEEGSKTAKSEEKSAKKVRFSMKNNLVWKPHSPLPPQSLRLPPSVTPRGSALKKGVPPGPVSEMSLTTKKVRRRVVSVKKAQKGMKSISPAIKRRKKLKSRITL